MTHPLTTRAMTANLSIGLWQGYRHDKAASAKATQDAGAASDAARVNKHLIPKEALAPIVTAMGAVRTHYYTNTMPWRDNGDRLMTRTLYLKFVPEHEELVRAFNDAVTTFLDNDYPSAIAKAEFRMGAMFDRDDYPSASELRHKFYARLEFDAVTTYNDFRVEIDQAHADKVRADMEIAMERRMQTAVGDVWKRMADKVSHLHDRMADPSKVFQDRTISSISELLDLIPGLNVMDDPNIEMVRKLIAKALKGVDAASVRADPALRSQVADETKAVMDKMSSFMAAFGAGFA